MATNVAVIGSGRRVFDQEEVRVEGRDKVSGKFKYTADVKLPDMLVAAFATSPLPHAKIVSIDTRAAREVPGVHAVLTSADLGPNKRSGRFLYDIPVLAYDRVRYIGDRVAAVAAETRYAAEEAARLIEVEYEELPAVLTPAEALAADAPVLHPDYESYFFTGKERPKRIHQNLQGSYAFSKGDADLAPHFAAAFRVFEHRFTTPRQHSGYIEPHATTVWIEADIVHVWTCNKQPFQVRQWLANVTGVALDKIIVEAIGIGGDFGGKGLSIDEYPCYYLALATGRPVKHVYTYVEELQASSARHPADLILKTAVDSRGRFLAHESKLTYNGGAYAGGKPTPSLMPGGSGYSTVGYHVPHVKLDLKTVYTNTIAGAHVRAPADVQIFFGWEQHVDMIAAELGIDPLELRLLNVVRDGQTAVAGEAVHDPMAVTVLETLQREIESKPAASAGAWGYALTCRHTGGGKTSVDATLHPNGIVEIVCGVPDQGSGAYTVAQRVFAETFGIGLDLIRVRAGSTNEAKQDPGSGGSRVTYILSNATQRAAEALANEIADRTGLTLRDGAFVNAAGQYIAYLEGVARATSGKPIVANGAYDGTQHDEHHPADYSFAVSAFDITVDRDTGAFALCDGVLVAEVGTIINPIAHQGQIDGGFVYGFGSSTMEEMPIDEHGKLTSLSLGDYKLPTMRDLPPLRTILVPARSSGGAYGSRMSGELSTSGVGPAIANGVAKVAGVRLHEFPITAERIYAALARRAETSDSARS